MQFEWKIVLVCCGSLIDICRAVKFLDSVLFSKFNEELNQK